MSSTNRYTGFTIIAITILVTIGAMNIIESLTNLRRTQLIPMTDEASFYLTILVVGIMLVIGGIVYIYRKNIGAVIATIGTVLNLYILAIRPFIKPPFTSFYTIFALTLTPLHILALLLLAVDMYLLQKRREKIMK
ncbi:hypothetical protein J4526_07990 [Desulfurococcaceae archaeon MEX13E-LK6-19]|nr:hypothetical protein J4526_07990 [Desulfurococcaceae archaeon MEX13E-LK6-19]